MNMSMKIRNIMKGSNDGFNEGYETYMLAKDDYHNILPGRKEAVKRGAQDKLNQNALQEKELEREKDLAQRSLDEMGGEVSIKSIQMNIWIGKALIFMSVLLWAAHFGFILWTFEPFGWSYKAYLIAIGITITFAILCERIFTELKQLLPERYYRVGRLFLAVTGAIAIAVVGLYLANIRADLSNVMFMTQQAVDVTGGQEYEQAISEFYEKSFHKLLIALTLFTISLDIVTGILLHLAMSKLKDYGDLYNQHMELKRIRNSLMSIAVENKRLEGAHEVFENEFLNGVALAEAELKDKAENSETYRAKKLVASLVIFIAAIVIILVLAINSMADTSVVAIDLSESAVHSDYAGISEFEKNKRAIGDVISRVNAGSKLYVIGITEDSLGKPYFIMTAKTSVAPGYFKEKIKRDKSKMRRQWQSIEGSLEPKAPSTDIFGAIYLAETIFKSNPSGKKELILFSDMRNTVGINLNSKKKGEILLAELSNHGMRIPRLDGVKVYVYGVHNKGNSDVYRNKLMNFWRYFFEKSKAELIVYTSMREIIDDAGTLTMNNQ